MALACLSSDPILSAVTGGSCLQLFLGSQSQPTDAGNPATQRLQTYQDACFLACESREALVLYDDLHDRLTASPTLIQELGLEQAEVERIYWGLRRISDRSCDYMNKLALEIGQDLPQPVAQAEGSQEEGKKPAGRPGAEDGNKAPAAEAAASEVRLSLDECWQVAEAAHSHLPWVFESVLLPAKPDADSQEVLVETTTGEK